MLSEEFTHCKLTSFAPYTMPFMTLNVLLESPQTTCVVESSTVSTILKHFNKPTASLTRAEHLKESIKQSIHQFVWKPFVLTYSEWMLVQTSEGMCFAGRSSLKSTVLRLRITEKAKSVARLSLWGPILRTINSGLIWEHISSSDVCLSTWFIWKWQKHHYDHNSITWSILK